MDILHFMYPFIIFWPFGLFLLFGYYEQWCYIPLIFAKILKIFRRVSGKNIQLGVQKRKVNFSFVVIPCSLKEI